jgi:phospholipid/cholesterol/gamma-HCH transport system permease protein
MTTATETNAMPTKTDAEAEVRKPGAFQFYAEELSDLLRVTIRTFYYIVRGKREKGDVIRQCFEIGNKSMFFMAVTMAFIGAIVLFQMCMQAKRIIPDLTMIGGMYAKLLIRELAPSVGAMPFATRVGAGIAAEIGSMVVTEQTDALRMSGADPVDYLVVPRFVASVIMGTIVLVLGAGIAYGAGFVVGVTTFDINPNTFINFTSVKGGDVALGLIKCVCYGGIIALVSSQRGLRTFGGSEGVGIATTQAVVGSLFAVIVANFILSSVGHFVFPP